MINGVCVCGGSLNVLGRTLEIELQHSRTMSLDYQIDFLFICS